MSIVPRLIQSGSKSARILICGEAPGAGEDRTGIPFVGSSGQELDKWCQIVGFHRGDFFITNVCHERPPNNEIEQFFGKITEAKKAKSINYGLDISGALAAAYDDYGGNRAFYGIAGRWVRLPVVLGLNQLQQDIDTIKPDLIMALGNTALWALTGKTGIIKWRGSVMEASNGPVDGHGCKLIPTLHPAAVIREQVWRAVCMQDFKRAMKESRWAGIIKPSYNFFIPKTVKEAENWLEFYILSNTARNLTSGPNDIDWYDDIENRPVAADVENKVLTGDLICLGLAHSNEDAICIPFMHPTAVANGDQEGCHYWEDPADELKIVQFCRKVLKTHPITFHNGLHDCQILLRSLKVMPKFTDDTMVGQHVLWPGMLGGKIDPITGKTDKKGSSQSLAFCASMYCKYYCFWKDDGRDWDPSLQDEKDYFNYNCEDVVRTYEIRTEELKLLIQHKLFKQYREQMVLFQPVLEMMTRGISFDDTRRRTMIKEVQSSQVEIQAWINAAVGHNLNVKSAQQMMALFYDDLKIPPILHRLTRKPTLDDKALEHIVKLKPVFAPLIHRIQALRSLGVWKENFLNVSIDEDSRLRGSLNVAGPETFRFSSNTNAFGKGFNLQNIPRAPED